MVKSILHFFGALMLVLSTAIGLAACGGDSDVMVDVERISVTESVTTGDGDRDDYATFKVKLDVTARGGDVYLSANHGSSLRYRLEDGTGMVHSIFTPHACIGGISVMLGSNVR